MFDVTNGWTDKCDEQLDELIDYLYNKHFKTMIITHQTDVVRSQHPTILTHNALNKEIQDFLFKHHLTQTHYLVRGSALFLYIYLNDGSCVIVKY